MELTNIETTILLIGSYAIDAMFLVVVIICWIDSTTKKQRKEKKKAYKNMHQQAMKDVEKWKKGD